MEILQPFLTISFSLSEETYIYLLWTTKEHPEKSMISFFSIFPSCEEKRKTYAYKTGNQIAENKSLKSRTFLVRALKTPRNIITTKTKELNAITPPPLKIFLLNSILFVISMLFYPPLFKNLKIGTRTLFTMC